MKTIKRYWLALIPFVIAAVYVASTLVYPVGASIYTRQWESVEQFTAWYDSQNFTLLFNPEPRNDCDDYAQWVQERALRQGYPISEAIAKNNYYAGIWVTDKYGLHDGCLVNIGNWYYWFEPKVDEFNMTKICPKD